MDYSAVPSDTDALHGASPWGSSSPRVDRSFPSPAVDPPDSPAPIRGHSYSQSQDSAPDSPYTTPTRGANGPASADGSTAQRPDLHPDASSQAHVNQHEGQAPATGQQYNAGQPQQRAGAARYHSTKQQRPVPQYKLQAKVTALERTGRKDPVIRFDVHVCIYSSIHHIQHVNDLTDQSTQISNHPIPRCPPHPL
jgi:hypothetical protein